MEAEVKRGISMAMMALLLACGMAYGAEKAPPAAKAPSAPSSSDASASDVAKKVDDLTTRVTQLEFQVTLQKILQSLGDHNSAGFDPTVSDFQRLDSGTGFGTFAVSIGDVRPYGDGVQLKVNFGNPSTASFDGVKVKVLYGARKPTDVDKPDFSRRNQEWHDSLLTKEMTLADTLRAGKWNPVEIALPGIASDKLGYVEISLQTSQISLGKQ
jgi:hypothetical protein